jgi:serine/threonine-protein kinase RIO1
MGGCVAKVEEVFPKDPPKHHGDLVKTISAVIVESKSGSAISSEGNRPHARRRTEPRIVVASVGANPMSQPHRKTSCVVKTTVPLSDAPNAAPNTPETETSHSSPSTSSESLSSSIVNGLSPTISGRIIPLRLVEKLGSGMDAKVYSARRVDRQEQGESVKVLFQESNDVALKITRKEKNGKKDKGSCERVLSEASILQTLRHPNIVKIYQVIETDVSVILVLEKALGDLVPQVAKNGPITERVAKRWTFQIISAMTYAHKMGYIHGDLKPDNILLRPDNSVCITDWAFSKRSDDPTLCSDFHGSLNYCPPELLLEQWGKSKPGDVWSMGATIYSLVTGRLPFGRVEEEEGARRRLVHAHLGFPPSGVLMISDDCKLLIRCMMRKDRSERPKMGECLDFEWLSGEKRLYNDFEAVKNSM